MKDFSLIEYIRRAEKTELTMIEEKNKKGGKINFVIHAPNNRKVIEIARQLIYSTWAYIRLKSVCLSLKAKKKKWERKLQLNRELNEGKSEQQ